METSIWLLSNTRPRARKPDLRQPRATIKSDAQPPAENVEGKNKMEPRAPIPPREESSVPITCQSLWSDVTPERHGGRVLTETDTQTPEIPG